MRLFRRSENRASDTTSYTDALIDLIVARASGNIAKASATAALETVAGIVARGFAAAEVEGPPVVTDALDARTRAMIGRALIRNGEIAFLGQTTDRLHLRPLSAWTVTGGYNPDEWRYEVHMAGPSLQTSRQVGSGDVAHFMFAADPARPWRGIGPLEAASLAGRLSAELVTALGDEAAATRGTLLPVPKDGQDQTVAQLKTDIGSLRGRVALVESQTLGNFTGERQSVAGSGWSPIRLGADPPDALVELANMATREAIQACGLNPGLFSESGTVSREAWRQALVALIQPLGSLAAEEMSMKTGEEVAFGWSELRAADVMSRARAFKGMREAGASFDSASQAAGLDLEEDQEPDVNEAPTPSPVSAAPPSPSTAGTEGSRPAAE